MEDISPLALSDFPEELIFNVLRDLPWDRLVVLAQGHLRYMEVALAIMVGRGMPPTIDWVTQAPWEEVASRGKTLLNELVTSPHGPETISDLSSLLWGPPMAWELMKINRNVGHAYTTPQGLQMLKSAEDVVLWQMTSGYRMPLVVAWRQLRIFARREFWHDIARAEVQAWLAFIPRVTDPTWPLSMIENVNAWIATGLQKAIRQDPVAAALHILSELRKLSVRFHHFEWPLSVLRVLGQNADSVTPLPVRIDALRVRFVDVFSEQMQRWPVVVPARDDEPVYFRAFDWILRIIRPHANNWRGGNGEFLMQSLLTTMMEWPFSAVSTNQLSPERTVFVHEVEAYFPEPTDQMHVFTAIMLAYHMPILTRSLVEIRRHIREPLNGVASWIELRRETLNAADAQLMIDTVRIDTVSFVENG